MDSLSYTVGAAEISQLNAAGTSGRLDPQHAVDGRVGACYNRRCLQILTIVPGGKTARCFPFEYVRIGAP